ncbi:quinone-dependent dihydroorotate dehydrogenase [Propionibacteriaceae bacterium Y1700]|uniref:quinone-dependent dihydroorotate dehydrogenase n=1 Tax=Microlunatus sp. Y1700 TaxID=3418487 RepID=UPI003DA7547F
MSGLVRITDSAYRRVLRPQLFRLGGGDAEVAHERTLSMINWLGRVGPARRLTERVFGAAGADPVRVAGIDFGGRVGLAAGVDKNGVGVRAWGALGFGHVELGTVTAHPQPGQDRPRLFRLPTSRAIINRMGFNNAGARALALRLDEAGVRRGNRAVGAVVGVSIGKGKITPLDEAVPDYLSSLHHVAPYADYVAINVSSPNTPGLRSLQDKGFLAELVSALVSEAASLQADDPVPIMVKLAPDLTPSALEEAVSVCVDGGVSGLIATNTTLERRGIAMVDQHLADQAGGLSGAPLTRRSRSVVAHLRTLVDLPIIGVGGIMSADHAEAMIEAGADLVQLYSGFIYGGPGLVAATNNRLAGFERPTRRDGN